MRPPRFWPSARRTDRAPADATTVTLPYPAITTTATATRRLAPCAVPPRSHRLRHTFRRAAELEGTGPGHVRSSTREMARPDRGGRQAVTGTRREIRAYVEMATNCSGIRSTRSSRELFRHGIHPHAARGPGHDRVVRNVESARQALRDIMASETTAPVAHTGPTAWSRARESTSTTVRKARAGNQAQPHADEAEPLKAQRPEARTRAGEGVERAMPMSDHFAVFFAFAGERTLTGSSRDGGTTRRKGSPAMIRPGRRRGSGPASARSTRPACSREPGMAGPF